MFYHWATETPLWARSITNIISHSSCIPLRSAMSEKHLFLFLYRAQNLLSLSLLFLSKNITSSTWLIPAVESLRLSGRASERGIRRSEVRFLVETQIFFFFIPCSWHDEKHLSLSLPSSKLTICLISIKKDLARIIRNALRVINAEN